jgi:hypothetical protein
VFRFFLLLSLCILAAHSNADSIKCGDSDVAVTDSKVSSDPFFTLKMSNGSTNKSFRFSVEKDYINIRCDKKADGTAVVLILHFCGGSGCTDLYNFGIIEAASGNVLLEPDQPWKGNAIKANGIMGKEIKPFSCAPNNGEICLHTKLELG